MPYRTLISCPAQVVDHDGAVVSAEAVVRKLDGLACHTDSVLNYAELDFADECGLRGGHPRLVVNEKGRLSMTVEVDSQRKLTRKELAALREDFEGQLTDGIGAGCFDALSTATGLAVELRTPWKFKCTQVQASAWRPKATTEKGNQQRIVAVKKLVDKLDTAPPAKASTKKPPAKKASPKQAPAKKPAANKPGEAATPAKKEQPNFKKLLRLLAKPERDQLFDQIKAELEACGNDLSSIQDGQYPYGNFNTPKLLRLLLKAGLPVETLDEKGNSMLIQAAGEAKCVELLLKEGADVNRVCDSYYSSTALIRAASLGKRKAVEVLLQHGADPKIKDSSGQLAVDLVDEDARDRQAIVDLLS
ncbi:ankyrin repeat domain-containing protein [Bremerella sp.]|uniref:ankyrin repeat domain-containing protein n=1 Tax=Bremerella sp. TaxID=2795602 RepID=UPI0039191E39